MLRRFIHFLIAAGISTAVCAIVFLPDWGEDPVAWSQGAWRSEGAQFRIQAEVSQGSVSWRGPAGQDKAAFTWVQTEKEPYRVRFVCQKHEVEADVTFNGKDEIVLEPDIQALFSKRDQEEIRRMNKSRHRPENEFRLIFRRVKGE